LFASLKAAYRIAKSERPHASGESLDLPAAVDTKLDESYDKGLRKIPLAGDTVGRKALEISEDVCNQLTAQFKSSRFELQVDEATDIVKDAHLITYVRYLLENDVREMQT
jgi:hypothetical protein